MSSHPSTNAIILMYLVLAAIAAGAALHLGVVFPVWLMVVVLFAVFLWGVATVSVNRRSLLPRFMMLVYALPFSTTLGYLWDDHYTWWHTVRATPLCQDHQLMSRLLLMGIIGLLGLMAGYAAAVLCWDNSRQPAVEMASRASRKTLGTGRFVLLLVAALGFSWICAPQETIFEVMYAIQQTVSLATSINFNTGYMVSYLILAMLYIDAERETNYRPRQRMKVVSILAVTAFIMIYLQMMRGHRECNMLVVALGSLYVTGPHGAAQAENIKRLFRRRVAHLAIPAVLVIVVFIMVGSVRFTLSSERISRLSIVDTFVDGFQQNTWTNVLLTNLGMAEEFSDQTLEYNHGQTYLDYLLSLPPGPIAYALGYERPLESDHGPAWWYVGLSAGGIHAVCVPFKSFGAAGAFGILGIYGFLFARCEMLNRRSVMSRMIYVATISAGVLWFWYGDMFIIRSLMIAAMLGWGYPRVSSYWTEKPAAIAKTPPPMFAQRPTPAAT